MAGSPSGCIGARGADAASNEAVPALGERLCEAVQALGECATGGSAPRSAKETVEETRGGERRYRGVCVWGGGDREG